VSFFFCTGAVGAGVRFTTNQADKMNNTPAAEKWTTRDICAHYKVTARTVKNLRDKGVLPCLKISSRLIRFCPIEVEAAFRRGR